MESTLYTFISKFLFASSFLVPVILFPLSAAIVISIIWGLSLIAVFSYFISRQQNTKPHGVIAEHLTIATIVIIATYFIGNIISGII